MSADSIYPNDELNLQIVLMSLMLFLMTKLLVLLSNSINPPPKYNIKRYSYNDVKKFITSDSLISFFIGIEFNINSLWR